MHERTSKVKANVEEPGSLVKKKETLSYRDPGDGRGVSRTGGDVCRGDQRKVSQRAAGGERLVVFQARISASQLPALYEGSDFGHVEDGSSRI